MNSSAEGGAEPRPDDAAPDGGPPPMTPVVWMIGKVQSGKTSIVRAMTQDTAAEIGAGYKAMTKTAKVYDFPAEAPMLRFLDTRGIGEVAYDPTDDLKIAEGMAHLLLVTMRAMDVAQGAIVDVVAALRRRHPKWPVVVAQTCLHEGYAHGAGHIVPYPHKATAPEASAELPLPSDLKRCLSHQRAMMKVVPGTGPILFVPLDITQPADAMAPQDYGLDALCDALISVTPDAMRVVLETLPSVTLDSRRRQADPVIMGHAMTAAGSDLVPAAGAVAVSAVQARLLQRLAQIYGVSWDKRAVAEFSAAIGTGIVTRTAIGFGIRQLVKLIPVYGQTIGAASSAAMSFAVTYALGKAAVYFLTQRQRGLSIAGTSGAYKIALRDAVQLARMRGVKTQKRGNEET